MVRTRQLECPCEVSIKFNFRPGFETQGPSNQFLYRKIVLVDVRVQIILVLKQLLLLMSRHLPNPKPPRLRNSMPFWFWAHIKVKTSRLLSISMVNYSFVLFKGKFCYFLFKEMSMMIWILSMVKEQQPLMAVEQPWWVNSGILAVVNKWVLWQLNYFDWMLILKASKIIGCRLERQSDLSFEFTYGTCNTFVQPTPRVLLCFPYTDANLCHT